jgi:hypothetical protein
MRCDKFFLTLLSVSSLCLSGCSRSNDIELAKARVEAEAAKAEVAALKAELAKFKGEVARGGTAGSTPKVESLPPDGSSTKPKVERPNQTMSYLRVWLKAKQLNDRQGLDNVFVDAELRKIPDLPYIRSRCREMFKVPDLTLTSLNQLQDWLCTTFQLSQDQADGMSLEEVAVRLRNSSKSGR